MSKISLILLSFLLSSCSMLGHQQVRHSKTTSLVGFLYPDGKIPNDLSSPVLRLPLRIGLAYIPENGRNNHIEPAVKLQLLNNIKQQFEGLRYVQSIEIIPQMYVSGGRKSNQLQQIQQLYQLDVMALVSYDQIVNRKENLLAVTYLTIVGNYIFPGSHFKVSTLLDMALIDLKTKRLLFRAAGSHGSKGATAEAYTRHQYDQHQNNGFVVAMNQLTVNLSHELQAFEQRLRAKDPNDDIKVEAKKGYEMAADSILLSLLLLFIGFKFLRVNRTPNINS